jgi:hypothetical protein
MLRILCFAKVKAKNVNESKHLVSNFVVIVVRRHRSNNREHANDLRNDRKKIVYVVDDEIHLSLTDRVLHEDEDYPHLRVELPDNQDQVLPAKTYPTNELFHNGFYSHVPLF